MTKRVLRFTAVAGASVLGLVVVVWSLLQIVSDVATHGSRQERAVALTFDADMTPRMQERLRAGGVQGWYDERIVSLLETEAVPATFFITGLWAETYPEVVKKIAAVPLFEVANHSYDHASFLRPCYGLPRPHDKIAQIRKTQQILTGLTGKRPEFFRFPGGCFSRWDLALLPFMGVRAVGWDVVSGDAFSSNTQDIVERTVSSTQNGSIIIMHLMGAPNAPMTAAALPSVIKTLRERGFSFVTVSRLLASD